MTRLWGLTVARNEAARYLQPMLALIHETVDGHFLYDDQSDDDTAALAAQSGSVVVVRPADVHSFRFSEPGIRQAAWKAFESAMSPVPGDWIVAIDADEFLVSTGTRDPRHHLDQATARATEARYVSVTLPIDEVFGFDGTTPLIRTDGFWAVQRARRIFAYQPDGGFDMDQPAAGIPAYATAGRSSSEPFGLRILHYGYAQPSDRLEKYNRYARRPGHLHSHIQSILTSPKTVRWDGPVPWVPDE